MPRRAFPKGYRVEASPRIRVKSKRNARTLVLPGAPRRPPGRSPPGRAGLVPCSVRMPTTSQLVRKGRTPKTKKLATPGI